MSDILFAWVTVMLLVIPVSLISVVLSLPRYKELWGHDMPLGYFMAAWGISYLVSLLFATVAFSGGIGVMLLVGAFR